VIDEVDAFLARTLIFPVRVAGGDDALHLGGVGARGGQDEAQQSDWHSRFVRHDSGG